MMYNEMNFSLVCYHLNFFCCYLLLSFGHISFRVFIFYLLTWMIFLHINNINSFSHIVPIVFNIQRFKFLYSWIYYLTNFPSSSALVTVQTNGPYNTPLKLGTQVTPHSGTATGEIRIVGQLAFKRKGKEKDWDIPAQFFLQNSPIT